uniref:Uncharacterized protein n=3 Tax=Canis lupus TaxID=9612 RepID=A0A8C0Q6U3_CANLF
MTGCLLIGNKYPNFEANTIIGHIHLYDFLRGHMGHSFVPCLRSYHSVIKSLQSCWAFWAQQRRIYRAFL